jgi:hypothetical protein
LINTSYTNIARIWYFLDQTNVHLHIEGFGILVNRDGHKSLTG